MNRRIRIYLWTLAVAHWGDHQPALAQQAYRQALNLSPRYGDCGFLDHLKEAGFSPAQIQTTEQVLVALAKYHKRADP